RDRVPGAGERRLRPAAGGRGGAAAGALRVPRLAGPARPGALDVLLGHAGRGHRRVRRHRPADRPEHRGLSANAPERGMSSAVSCSWIRGSLFTEEDRPPIMSVHTPIRWCAPIASVIALGVAATPALAGGPISHTEKKVAQMVSKADTVAPPGTGCA